MGQPNRTENLARFNRHFRPPITDKVGNVGRRNKPTCGKVGTIFDITDCNLAKRENAIFDTDLTDEHPYACSRFSPSLSQHSAPQRRSPSPQPSLTSQPHRTAHGGFFPHFQPSGKVLVEIGFGFVLHDFLLMISFGFGVWLKAIKIGSWGYTQFGTLQFGKTRI
jgi:hypothetical protein